VIGNKLQREDIQLTTNNWQLTTNNWQTDQCVDLFLSEEKTVSGSGRIPLWVVATIAGLGVITVVGIFFYGSYSGIGSSM
jgi:photosystem II PsbJ protein